MARGSLPAGTECPRCGVKLELERAGPATCAGCGGGMLPGAGGGAYAVARLPRALEAVDVATLLARSLSARRAPRPSRLLEIHRLELPYWQLPSGELRAAFATALGAARRLPAPAAGAEPAPLERLPAVAAEAVEPRPVRLLLVPAFDLRYEVRGRVFHALIDAAGGALLADLFPHPLSVRVHLAMAAVLALDVAAFAAAAYLAPDNLVRTLAVAALALPVYAFTAATFRLRDR